MFILGDDDAPAVEGMCGVRAGSDAEGASSRDDVSLDLVQCREPSVCLHRSGLVRCGFQRSPGVYAVASAGRKD